jgi:hypothetical protein
MMSMPSFKFQQVGMNDAGDLFGFRFNCGLFLLALHRAPQCNLSSGIVEAKEQYLSDLHIVRIDGDSYFTDKDGFDAAVVGNEVTIRGSRRPRDAW